MASPAPTIDKTQTPGSLPTLTEELLEEIFLHLPTPAALARASTACASFRRIITDRSFLRRFRALHPPPLLGIADAGGFHPAQAPHPSAPLARALTSAADFTYSFVPKPNKSWLTRWSPRDVRDGRVLLECSPYPEIEAVFSDLAVCDPLSRRYVLLPPIPEDLTVQQEGLVEFEPILSPTGENEDETSFKVICTAHFKTKLVVFVFSSVTREWRIAASPSWSSLGTAEPDWRRGLSCFDYVRGCFYWMALWTDNAIVLDTRTMEFYTVEVMTGYHTQRRSMPCVVMGREGALEIFSLVGDYIAGGSSVLYHTTQYNSGDSSNEWQLENTVRLPGQYDFSTVGAAEGFLFLRGAPEDHWEPNSAPLPENWDVDYFSLEVKTSELKKVCRIKQYEYVNRVHPYFGFPPSLSKPSI